jgi:hypothetical protein
MIKILLKILFAIDRLRNQVAALKILSSTTST